MARSSPSRLSLIGACATLLLSGCAHLPGAVTLVTRPAHDGTPPDKVTLQALIDGQPMATVSARGTNVQVPLGEPGQLALVVTGSDADGGVKAVRIVVRETVRRKTGPSRVRYGIETTVAQTVSLARVGDQAPESATARAVLDTNAMLGPFNDLILEAFAEVENFDGAILKSPTLIIPERLVRLKVRAIAARDSHGGHASNVTDALFAGLIDRVNDRFQGTMIRFVVDPTHPVQVIDDDDLAGDGQTPGGAQLMAGNQIAAATPDAIPIIFRWGDLNDPAATGNGNGQPPPSVLQAPRGWTGNDQRYVVLNGVLLFAPGSTTPLDRNANDGAGNHFAHELGHFLGLNHTFPGMCEAFVYNGGCSGSLPADARAAEAKLLDYAAALGGGVDAFDGDGIVDTPPDPGPLIYDKEHLSICPTAPGPLSVALGNLFTLVFTPDFRNVMSYYHGCDEGGHDRRQTFTPQQIALMHRALKSPERAPLVP